MVRICLQQFRLQDGFKEILSFFVLFRRQEPTQLVQNCLNTGKSEIQVMRETVTIVCFSPCWYGGGLEHRQARKIILDYHIGNCIETATLSAAFGSQQLQCYNNQDDHKVEYRN